MHRDQKIGLTLAVLILGFAGAFCFRNPPPMDAQPLALSATAELDARIEQLPVRAYTAQEGVSVEDDRQVAPSGEGLSAQRGLADQIVRFGAPGSQQVLAEEDLVDLFLGPPEPLVVERPADRRRTAVFPQEEGEPVLPEKSIRIQEASPVLPSAAKETPSAATSGAEQQPSPASYVVRSGDTLSDIAEAIYGDSRRYLDLYRANRDVLSDPDDLPVGTTLRLR